MQDLNKILSQLTPEKRVLLEKKLLKDPQSFNAFPLSFSQRRLWFLNQLDPTSTAYNIPYAIEISGPLRIEILEKCVNNIVQRHEVLRSTIISVSETPLQIIQKSLNTKIEIVKLSSDETSGKPAEFNERIKKLNNTIFDLTKGPLFKCTLFILNDSKFVFHIVMHHIIADGWSVGIFINEFIAGYNSYLKNDEPNLPDLKIQYADYAKWQNKWLGTADYNKQLDYWKSEFSDLPEPLNLPFDFQRPKIKKYNGSTTRYKLNISDISKFRDIANTAGCSSFMIFLAILKILLYKFSNSQDIAIGTPIANRERIEIQGLIGFFVNTLVIRNQINSRNTFNEFLNALKNKVLSSFDNQEIPFETIIEHLHPDRNMGITPLFQVMFSYEKDPKSTLHISNLSINPFTVENDKSKFDMSFAISENNLSEFELSIEYDTDLFNIETINRFAESFQNLVSQIIDNPSIRISQISVLSNEDNEIYKKLNSTDYSNKSTENLVQLLERNSSNYDRLNAVICNGVSITYQELNERANKIARSLRKRGISQDSIVAMLFERSIDAIVTLISIWKAGAAYLPLVPTYPNDRIRQILEDANPHLLVTESNLISSIDHIQIDTLLIDKSWDIIDKEYATNLGERISPSNLAYIIYTSGSTGRPKGVMIEHKTVVNLAFGLKDRIYNDVKDNLVVSLNAPLLFDASVQQIVQLCFGHTLNIIPEETRIDAEKLLEYIRKEKIDVLDCVPTQLKFLIEYGLLDEGEWIPRKILPGGEAIDEITWQKIRDTEIASFYNMYGPTECTVDPTIYPIKMNGPGPRIGTPINNVRGYVLSDELQLASAGVPGELYIAGECLARGYFNRPDLTALKFIPDPFTKIPGSRMYSTGDRVRLREDGNLEYMERIDDQIKLRGFRIELGEIDYTITTLEEVKQSCTIIKNDSSDIFRLISFCVVGDGHDINPDTIIDSISDKLPDYMVPSNLIILDKFPLLPNGKVDKNALMKLKHENFRHEEIAALSTETEKKVAKIFSNVLQLDHEISKKDNFFDLGGHSLLATKCISRIRDSFKVDMPLRIIFEKSNIESISNYIDGLLVNNKHEDISIIPKVERSNQLPLSFAQERLWFIDKLDPNNSAYNIPSAFRIKGVLNIFALTEAFKKIIERHEVLRTSIYTSDDGLAFQRVHSHFEFNLNQIDISNLGISDKKEKLSLIIKSEINNYFNLNNLFLFRVNLIHYDDDEHILIITMHHIISDGWSSTIFFEELSNLYNSVNKRSISSLKSLPIQYADYSCWQREWLKGENMEKQLQFWKRELYDIPGLLELPLDKKRPPIQTFNGEIKKFIISKKAADGISLVCKSEEVTSFMFLISAFFILLYKNSRQNDIAIGTPIANRNKSEIESLIGFFVNTIVIREKLNNKITFRELLRNVHNTSLKAYSNQDLPFEKLVDALNIERNVSHSPIFQVMFVYQNLIKNKIELEDISIEQLDIESETSKFDISLNLSETVNGELSGAFEYNTDIFYPNTIDRLIEQYKELVTTAIEKPDDKIEYFEALTQEDNNLILEKWNSTRKEYRKTLLHNLIDEIATQSSNSVAVRKNDKFISFGELNKRANQLANYFISTGIEIESKIGISLDPSIEMIIAIVAILKAGATYVPLDPTYPPNRTNYIVENSGIKAIITQSNYEGHLKTITDDVIIISEKLNEITEL